MAFEKPIPERSHSQESNQSNGSQSRKSIELSERLKYKKGKTDDEYDDDKISIKSKDSENGKRSEMGLRNRKNSSNSKEESRKGSASFNIKRSASNQASFSRGHLIKQLDHDNNNRVEPESERNELQMYYKQEKAQDVEITKEKLDEIDKPLSYAPPKQNQSIEVNTEVPPENEDEDDEAEEKDSHKSITGRQPFFDYKKAVTERMKRRNKPIVSRSRYVEEEDNYQQHTTSMTSREIIESANRLSQSHRPKSTIGRFRTIHDDPKFENLDLDAVSNRLYRRKNKPLQQDDFKLKKGNKKIDTDQMLQRLYAKNTDRIPDSRRTVSDSERKENYLASSYAWKGYN